MDKTSIRKYAVWARSELMRLVALKVAKYGIVKGEKNKAVVEPIVASALKSGPLTDREVRQRNTLEQQVRIKGLDQVVEEVAYTWFNRLVAIRFMEENGYLPSRVRVLGDGRGHFRPEIMDRALDVDLEGIDRDYVVSLKNDSRDDELYKYLLITECNSLSAILPGLFGRISDYTQLLLPDGLLRSDSVAAHLVEDIPQEDWHDQVQIIGWLYQYYNSERKRAVFDDLDRNVKISKDNIPAATGLFTPDWIVRYMVENSLGRVILGNTDVNPVEDYGWKYYLDAANETSDGKSNAGNFEGDINPEEIRAIDPCCGSGHILVYMFDLLMGAYGRAGYVDSDAVRLIIENNLWGLDIDLRAAELSYFAVMMVARSYDTGLFNRKHADGTPDVPSPHIYAITQSNDIDAQTVASFCGEDGKIKSAVDRIITEMRDATEYGSIIHVGAQDWKLLYDRLDALERESGRDAQGLSIGEASDKGQSGNALHENVVRDKLLPLIQVAQTLSQEYDAVVTNPPYMGGSGMNAKLAEYVKKNYADYKSDLFSVCVVRCMQLAKPTGYLGFLTPYVWMFIQSYEKLRTHIYENATIETLIQFEYSAFEEATVPICTFALRNQQEDKNGSYLRLTEFRGGMEIQRQKAEEAVMNHDCGYYYEQNAKNFSKIPGSPVAYWVGSEVYDVFVKGKALGSIVPVKKGLDTGNNDLFLKLWFEVSNTKLGLKKKSAAEFESAKMKWAPHDKGGEYRRWYGNNEWVIDWEDNGYRLKCSNANIRSERYYFSNAITWGSLSSGKISFRWSDEGAISNTAGSSIYPLENQWFLLGFLNTVASQKIIDIVSPTLNYSAGPISHIPIIYSNNDNVDDLVQDCISLSRADWDSFETSWDFSRHPMTGDYARIADAYAHWRDAANAAFDKLRSNEEELNRIFIDIYDLADELTPEVAERDVTVHRVFDTKEEIPEPMRGGNYALTKADCVKSLLSYAVGCMFGRYSLDAPGLQYAGGDGAGKGRAMIPVCDDDYFTDDIMRLLEQWLAEAYGADTVEENLTFIASALGSETDPRAAIRAYFLHDFYKDHCKAYQKRPIYWLYDAGRQDSFKCLVYMHRFRPDTMAKLRTDYVLETQERIWAAEKQLGNEIESATAPAAKAKLTKRLAKLCAQDKELADYEAKIQHHADAMKGIDLDDGVKHNYELFADVLAKIK